MAIGKRIYDTLFRRTSTFAVTILASAFIFERIFDQGMDSFWEWNNQGKLWKHIEPQIKARSENSWNDCFKNGLIIVVNVFKLFLFNWLCVSCKLWWIKLWRITKTTWIMQKEYFKVSRTVEGSWYFWKTRILFTEKSLTWPQLCENGKTICWIFEKTRKSLILSIWPWAFDFSWLSIRVE